MINTRSARKFALFILAIRLALGVLYAVVTPLWEGNDEPYHYLMARFIAREGRLPTAEDRPITGYGGTLSDVDQFSQPPLYHIAIAPLIALFDPGDHVPIPNPDDRPSNCPGDEVPNLVLHDREAETFPWRGAALAAHLARFFSVLLSVGAVGLSYIAARELFPERREWALGAMLMLAFWMPGLYNGSLVNNDSMAFLTGSLVFYFGARLTVRGSPRVLVGLAISSVLAVLSKLSGLVILPLPILAILAYLWHLIRCRFSVRQIFIALGGVALAGIVLALFFARNLEAFGGLTGRYTAVINALLRGGGVPLRWRNLNIAVRQIFWTSVAAFGWQNISASPPVYGIGAIWFALVGFGFALAVFQDPERDSNKRLLRRLAWPVGLCVILLAVMLFRAVLDELGKPFAPARYLLPVSGAISLLAVVGLSALLRGRRLFWGILPLIVLAFYAPFGVILPAYAPPPRITPEQFAALEDVAPLEVTFENGAVKLLGYRVEAENVHPGESVRLTLFWALARSLPDADRRVSVIVIGPELKQRGLCIMTPGHGMWPLSDWRPGEIVQDSYNVVVSEDFPAPALGRFGVALWGEDGEIFSDDGGGLSIIGAFGVHSRSDPQPPQHALDYTLGDHFRLIGYDWEDDALTLHWEARAEPDRSYAVMVHIVNADGERLRDPLDSVPRSGTFPTDHWLKGEHIADVHAIPPVEGRFWVEVGLYVPVEPYPRLEVLDDQGQRAPNDAIRLGPFG